MMHPLLKRNLPILLGLFSQQMVAAQQIAFARPVNRTTVMPDQMHTDATVRSLKDALTDLSRRYQISILFEESTVQGYRVPVGRLSRSEKPDKQLEVLLKPYGLQANKVNEQTYLVIPAESKEAGKTRGVSDVTGTAPVAINAVPLAATQPASLPAVGSAAAAEVRLTGQVTSETGEGLPGVTVLVKGANRGTNTDADGRYQLTVPDERVVLVFSFVGFVSQEVTVGNRSVVNVRLTPDTKSLNEVVVIGYGTQRRKDLTGSVATVSSKDFVQGQVTNPEQLVSGKIAGVQITSNGGAPGAGGTIRIRGGSSLNASNDPLIVVDGVPLDNSGISGSTNALSLINPNDIETVTVLKDASATAIYGSRASNGVILITTKKGIQGDKLHVNFNSQFSLAQKTKTLNVLSGDALARLVYQHGTPTQQAFVGYENTNWQEAIYQTARTTDNNLSVTGTVAKMPFRVSGGYLNQTGILKTSKLERFSGSLGLTPMLLDNHLRIDINLKGTIANSRFADQGAIGSAAAFDPTQPILSGNEKFGGYYEWLQSNGAPNVFSTRNPVALLNLRNDVSTVQRSIGNVQFDYKFHFLPELRANLNVGYDISRGSGTTYVPAFAASQFTRPGLDNQYAQSKTNKLLEFYLNYTKDLKALNSRVEVLGGYSYQDFIRENPAYPDVSAEGKVITPSAAFPFKTQNTLVSFYGRLNYTFNSKYLLTATLRDDGSSRFNPNNRWGVFPSAALAWRVKDESFLKTSNVVSDLKFRVGYGVTGQQDISPANTTNTYYDYPYLARYTIGQGAAQYQFGSTFYTTLRPEGYDANIKWESTTTYNAGLDYGFFDGRLSGAVDVYLKKTKDLLSVIPVAAGSNLTNQILTNVGNLENRGVEFSINAIPVRRKDFTWDVNFNVTFNQNKITKLTQVADPTFQGNPVGDISGGVGNKVQIQSVGYPTYSYYVYKQVYDAAGKPIEGLYADLNGDGKITADDRYRYQSSNPKVYLGFSSNLAYRKLNLAFTLRSNLNNYVYNNINSGLGVFNVSSPTYLSNVTADALTTGFRTYQYFSDYYVQNASFLRLENVTVGYDASRLVRNNMRLRVSLAAQNLFVITKYTGLDPEISGGIDNNFYPRARTLTLGVNLGF